MHIASFCSLALLASSLTAQDFLHYRFESSCTDEVINYASGAGAFPGNGSIQSTHPTSPFAAGVFGGGFASGSTANTYHNRVLTGWDPGAQPLTGDMTMAWFMRLDPNAGAPTGVHYLMGAPSGGFRLFTGGVGGVGLYQREVLAGGGNGTNANTTLDFYLPPAVFDVQAAAAAGWVHIAMVVDSAAQTADWYVNGTSVLQLTGVPGANIVLPGPFMVGGYSTSATAAGCVYEFDEFLLSKRAYTPNEMLALSLAPRAGDGDYESGIASQCGAGNVTLSAIGGEPFAGNSAFGFEVSTVNPNLFLLFAGFDRCSVGGVLPLPLDGGTVLPGLLTGCWVLTDPQASLPGATSGAPVQQPFAIPTNIPGGVTVYAQVFGLDLTNSTSAMSNGYAFSVGF